MNILLTTSAAPRMSPFFTGEKKPPIGLGFLISVLRNKGHKVFFIDNYLKPSNFLTTNYLIKNKIDFVGIHANTICYRDTRRMLHKIQRMRQKKLWNGKVIVGGPHTSVALETIPDFVDYVVQGEGERAIVDIVEGKANERVIRAERIKNLDELPPPAWDYFVKLPYDWSAPFGFIDEQPVFSMNTSRGCPFKCSFCSVNSIWGHAYTYFSAERIVEEVEFLVKKYGAKGIYFREDNFTVDKDRVTDFCQLILSKSIPIKWVCETRIDMLTEDLLKLMYQAGCRGLYIGVESGSQRILDFLKKGISVEQIKEVFSWCQQIGIKTYASCIVGVPIETKKDARLTHELMNQIKPDVTGYNIFVGIPRSELYDYVLENKLWEYIDNRGLVYLKGHNALVRKFYNGNLTAIIPRPRSFVSVILRMTFSLNLWTRLVISLLPQPVIHILGKLKRFVRPVKATA